ncbi:MAG TPA: redoxin domain-containing protein [Candidatus Obscuribacterales bacterium]
MRSGRSLALVICLALSIPGGQAAWHPAEGQELIGRPAPEFSNLVWLNCRPLTMKQLLGKVVLIRFWFTDCSLCRATAPALNELHERYGRQGLVVIGIHHPKSAAGHDPGYVRRNARELGFAFPIAQDRGWSTVRAFWLDTGERSYTSASFLVDRQGDIRWVHEGGEFHSSDSTAHAACDAAYRALEAQINELLRR